MNKITKLERDYDFLNNGYYSPFEWEGIIYPTAEHAYQASKVINPVKRMEIAAAPNPRRAKELVENIRHDWNDNKFAIMFEITKAKFLHSPELTKKLLGTKNIEIDYNEDHLGIILMIVRKELQICEEIEKELNKKENE